MGKKRKIISLRKIYSNTVPLVRQVISSSISTPLQSPPSISISAAQAGTGTEVATMEQLANVFQEELPTLFSLPDPPVFDLEEHIPEASPIDPFELKLDDIGEALFCIIQENSPIEK